MTKWDARYTYRAAKPAHRWRLSMPGAWQCRICDMVRVKLKDRLFGYAAFPGAQGVPAVATPPCPGVQ